MTNFEKYANEILSYNGNFSLINDEKLHNCYFTPCAMCDFNDDNNESESCTTRLFKWLYEEARE